MKIRILLATILYLIFSGQVINSFSNGILSPVGFLMSCSVHVLYAMVIEAYIQLAKPTIRQLVIANFVLYSLIIHGFLFGEIVTLLGSGFWVTMFMFLSWSFMPIFVYAIIERISNTRANLNLKKSGMWLLGYALLMSPSGRLGLYPVLNVIKHPFIAVAALVVASVFVCVFLLPTHETFRHIRIKQFEKLSLVLVLFGLFPFAQWHIVYMILMMTLGLIISVKHGTRSIRLST